MYSINLMWRMIMFVKMISMYRLILIITSKKQVENCQTSMKALINMQQVGFQLEQEKYNTSIILPWKKLYQNLTEVFA